MKLWLAPLATKVGFHKPEVGPPYESDPHPRFGQGGTLVSSPRESVWANKQAPLNRIPAVVGLAAPPYGLPSTDPTTPAPVVQLRCTTGPSSRCSSGSRWWSAHADNSGRSEFPLDPLLSRQDRPLRRPSYLRTEDSTALSIFLLSSTSSAPHRGSL
jgi:hypothetical protein